MAQPQLQQNRHTNQWPTYPIPNVSNTPNLGNVVYTINRVYDGKEYMLKTVKPHRVWTQKSSEALIFHDATGARVLINQFFKNEPQDDITVGRIPVGD